MLYLDKKNDRRLRVVTPRAAPAAVALGMVLTGLVLPAPSWAAAGATSVATAEPAGVRIVGSRARITHDGSVRVRIRSRCPATFQAYELTVGVRQGGTFGSATRVRPPDVVVCDGIWRRSTVLVPPEGGTFEPGPADVSVFLGLFDPGTGSDADVEASKVLELGGCRFGSGSGLV